MHTDRVASWTWRASASACEYTETVSMPASRQARRTRRAISPRLAINTRFSMACNGTAAPRRKPARRFPSEPP